MKDEDLFKCPLIRGLDPMHRAELVGLLNDSSVREHVEKCLTNLRENMPELCATEDAAAEPKAAPKFEEAIHNWTPAVPIFRRGAKE
jgi:hypothetical protein